ncbi:hypothetical protein MMC10_002915 [Thelotrema lepadinum]|nr:hypothetical protein [Thelotrema lepadinum]
MAASVPGLPTRSAVSHEYFPTVGGFKLRNSCNGCASSKLKCSQERPTCSRCAKRRIPCEYLAAKQGGRKPNRQSARKQSHGELFSDTATNATSESHLPSQDDWFGPPSSNSDFEPLHSPDVMQRSHNTSNSTSSDMIQDLFGSTDRITCPTTQTDLSNYLPTPGLFSAEMSDMTDSIDMTDIDYFGPAQIFGTDFDSSNNRSRGLSSTFSAFEDPVSELFTVSTPLSIPKTSSLPSMEAAQSYQGLTQAKPPNCCLDRALSTMKQISSVSYPGNPPTIPTIRAIVSHNKTALEAVATMLGCTCSQDGYLLAVMSLIVFKVLDWYATVSQEQPSQQDLQAPDHSSSTVLGSRFLKGTDAARMTAQLVLSELYLVRRLIEQLSLKLKDQAARDGKADEKDAVKSFDLNQNMVTLLSSTIGDPLAVALPKRLRSLSLTIINQLREL